MTTSNRIDAQRRTDDIQIFNQELQRLEAERVLQLDPAQRAAIHASHQILLAAFAHDFDIDRDTHARQLSLGMRIASFLGAAALAASVFFLFYQFWGWFTTPVQVLTLITAASATFVITFWIQHKDSSGYFAKLAALVAFACFVLNMVMLGQIFNITPSDKALLPWAALALLLAYALDLRLLLVAGLMCLISFVAARVGTWNGMYWLDFGERPENFFPAAIVLFFVPQLFDHRRFAGFAPTFRIVALLALFLPMLLLANWGAGSYLPLSFKATESLYQITGFVGTALAIWYGVRRQLNDVVNTSVTLFVIFLYTKMFDWWWKLMPKYLFFLTLGLTAVLLLFILKRLRTTNAYGPNREQEALR